MSMLARASLESAITAQGLPPESVIFGQTAAMAEVRQKLERVAGANLSILITGESGTGKDIIARLLHLYSPWANGPYVKINCPAIPGSLLESELFGYERGAFTGASGTKPGRVEMAHRGTLFLDEISELDPALQAKLLQLLQDGQFSRIGSQEDTKVEVMVVSATNRELHRQMEDGNFRNDLFYRIAAMTIHLPALRDRAVDIPLISEYLLEYYNDKLNGRAPMLRPALLAKMQRYSWPGNVRQLENLIKRYVVMGTEDVILSELLQTNDRDALPDLTFDGPVSLKKLTRQAVRKVEARIILSALHANNWNRKKSARALGISYRALLYKLKDVGVPQRRASVSAVRAEDAKSD
jgi:two-component system response regulator AtoC